MIIGQLLDGLPNAASIYFSPWFPRGGNLAKFTCEVIATDDLDLSGDSFKISVQTKNSEDSDKDVSTPQGGTSQGITLTAMTLTTWGVGASLSSANMGFEELVRFRYELTSSNASTQPWVHFRMLNPIWLTN